MALKENQLSATLAWSHSENLLAAGTAAGSIDVSFSSSPSLQILAPDFTNGTRELPILGSPTHVQEPFNRLSWGGLDAGGHMGIIAGGLADGGVLLWDPARLAKAATNGGEVPGAQISRLSKHTGAVKGVEFNRHTPSLLATGATDGELCIWDVAAPTAPTLYPALKGGGGGQTQQPEIAALAWNKRVEWILATCSVNGTATVWDLKKQKPVITLRDAAGRMRRSSAVAWNPEVATQLLVACADDLSPTIQLWDLRNNSAPIKELLGHNKGVLSLSWNTHDPSLLLSAGRDGRTLLWDVPGGVQVGEIQVDQGWVLEVAWSPTTPGVFASACFGDGHSDMVAVHNLASFTAPRTQESFDENFAAQSVTGGGGQPLQKAPNWLKRPVSACLGFGGRLVKVINQKRQLVEGGPQVDVGEIHLSQVVTESTLLAKSEEFERAIGQGDRVAVATFCEDKVINAQVEEESETWSFLRVLFDDDARRVLLTHLGFEDMLLDMEEPGTGAASLTAGVDELTIAGGASPAASHGDSGLLQGNDTDFFEKEEVDGGASFFEELQPQSVPVTPHKTPDYSPRPSGTAASEPPEGEAGESEDAIMRALYVGNFTGAVEACLANDRMADALLLGWLAGGEVAQKTQREYMRRHPRPYMKIVHAVLSDDMLSLVKSRPLDGWRETLALLCAYSKTEEFAGLCDALARRLAGVGLSHAATMSWICAGNVEKAVRHWESTVDLADPQQLQDLMERAVVLGIGAGQRQTSPALAAVINEYASILAAQGRMSMALDYLDMVPGEATSSTAILRDRIVRSGAPGVDTSQAVPFPFIAEDVGGQGVPAPGPAPVHAPAASQVAAKSGADFYQRNAYNISGAYGNGTASGYAAQAPPPPPPPAVTLPASAYPAAGGYGAPAAANAYGAPAAPAANAYGAPTAPQYGQAQAYGGYGDNYRGGSYAANTAPAGGMPLAGGGGSGTYAAQMQAPTQHTPAPPAQQAAGLGAYGATATQQYGQAGGFFTPSPAPLAPPPTQTLDPAVGGGVYMPSRPTSSHTTGQAPQTFVPTPAPALSAPAPINAPPNHFGAPGAYPTQSTPFTPTAAGAGGGASAPPTPPAPTGPPPNITVTNADISQVPTEMQPVVKALRGLFDVCSAAAASAPGKKREMEDNSKRLGGLFWRLNKGDVSPSVAASLTQLAAALEARDLATASQIQVSLTATDWDECSTWLTALKRLIKTRQTLP